MTTPLRHQLIRLAHENPELRPQLLPILNDRAAGNGGSVMLLSQVLSTTDDLRAFLQTMGSEIDRVRGLLSGNSETHLTDAHLIKAVQANPQVQKSLLQAGEYFREIRNSLETLQEQYTQMVRAER
jgi:hypothetical protein